MGVLPAGAQAGKQQVERQEDLNWPNPLVARVGSRSIREKGRKKTMKARLHSQDGYSVEQGYPWIRGTQSFGG